MDGVGSTYLSWLGSFLEWFAVRVSNRTDHDRGWLKAQKEDQNFVPASVATSPKQLLSQQGSFAFVASWFRGWWSLLVPA